MALWQMALKQQGSREQGQPAVVPQEVERWGGWAGPPSLPAPVATSPPWPPLLPHKGQAGLWTLRPSLPAMETLMPLKLPIR